MNRRAYDAWRRRFAPLRFGPLRDVAPRLRALVTGRLRAERVPCILCAGTGQGAIIRSGELRIGLCQLCGGRKWTR